MKAQLFFGLLSALAGTALADSTINSTNAFAHGANIGWMTWRPSAEHGVRIDEYVLSGYIYAANVGWIHLGNGAPTSKIQYSNASSADYGVNYSVDASSPGKAFLRGYAYGANIGWIRFENLGNPRLSFADGRLEGYAYSANCGWINLGDGTFTGVQTDTIAAGLDSDADGMADAFEFLYLGGFSADPAADIDGDGVSNLDEYLNGTLPQFGNDFLRITAFSTDVTGENSSLSWTSTVARLYTIESTTDLIDPNSWIENNDFGISFPPDAGSSTTKSPLTEDTASRRFWRVRAIRPLSK